jgi:HK97 gp10 family phage protein
VKSKLTFDLGAIEATLKRAAERAVVAVAEEATGDLRELLNAPGRGEPVKRYSPRRTVRPSLPGDPPGKDQGKLQQSIQYAKTTGTSSVSARIGANTEYARRLEFGFKGFDSAGRYITQAPRPFMEPTLRRNAARYRKIAEAEVREVMRSV